MNLRFARMRRSLIERGLIHPETHELTAAGDAYCAELLERLRGHREGSDRAGARVRWTYPKRRAA